MIAGHYISAGRSTHCACHHWRPNLPSGCCICLEQSAGVSTGIAVTASFSQQTEDRAFCPVVQQLWLRASHCTDYHVTSLLFLRVTCPCSLRTYATLKFIHSSLSSSSSSSLYSGNSAKQPKALLIVFSIIWNCQNRPIATYYYAIYFRQNASKYSKYNTHKTQHKKVTQHIIAVMSQITYILNHNNNDT